MRKSKTSSYIIQHKIKLEIHEEHIIDKYLNASRILYNEILTIALKRSNALKKDGLYQKLIKEKPTKERNNKLKELRLKFGFTEYQLHEKIKYMRRYFNIGSNEAQVIATRAFRTVENFHYNKSSKINFKKRTDFMTIENKSNDTGLHERNGILYIGKLKIKIPIKKNDKYAHLANLDRTKYVRLIKKIIKGKHSYFIQIIKEGVPPIKNRIIGDGAVGIDIGTSTIAVVSNKEILFRKLIKEEDTLKYQEKKLRKLQRKIERSRRKNNPHKYNLNGTIKSNDKEKWIFSKNYMKLINKYIDFNRLLKIKRKENHECLANYILSLGNEIKIEEMNFHGLSKRTKETKINNKGKNQSKKRFGKSILNYAPSMLLNIINRKLSYFGKELIKINTYKVKASQYNHIENIYIKKKLSDRWNVIDGKKVHRDLYSAFLIQHVEDDLETINIKECKENYNSFLEKHNLLLNIN